MIRLSKSSVGPSEKEAVSAVMDRGFFGMGAEVAAFESELSSFLDRPVACTVNGTAALQLALQACGIGPGDEVLVQSLTYVASFQAISATGAKPVACDVIENTMTLDPEDARRRLTERTRAIMPIHFSGGVGDIDAIYKLAEEHNLRVIEDAAHAFGTTLNDQYVGGFGDVVCFSFDGIKNITSGEGGCVCSADEAVMSRVRDLRLLGVKGDSTKRAAGERTWAPDVEEQGWRYHMSDLMAAIGRAQLRRLPEFAAQRRALVDQYRHRFDGNNMIRCLQFAPRSEVTPHIFVIQLANGIDRENVRALLTEQGIQTGVHYYPNHWLSYYAGSSESALPVTEKIAGQILSLPLHFDLTSQDVDFVCDQVEAAIASNAGTPV
jgi:dTDP-4-amino-4,6-dideoxygalactose transaminase